MQHIIPIYQFTVTILLTIVAHFCHSPETLTILTKYDIQENITNTHNN